MALRNRIATAAVALGAAAFVAPIASSSAAAPPALPPAALPALPPAAPPALPPVSAGVGVTGEYSPEGIQAKLAAAVDAWKLAAQGGFNGIPAAPVVPAAPVGIAAPGALPGLQLGAQVPGFPANVDVTVPSIQLP